VNSAHVVILVVRRLEQQVGLPPLHLDPQLTFVREVRTARLPYLRNTTRAVSTWANDQCRCREAFITARQALEAGRVVTS
jgi:hypothetical protein